MPSTVTGALTARVSRSQSTRDRLVVVHPAGQDHELVAAEPGHDVVRVAHHLGQPLAEHGQQVVAGVVAERVVDVLEAVQVEQDHGEAALAGQHRLGALAGGAPVEQAGELVPPGGPVHRAAVPDVARPSTGPAGRLRPRRDPAGRPTSRPDQIPDRAGVDTTTAQEVAMLLSRAGVADHVAHAVAGAQHAVLGGLHPAQAAVRRTAQRRADVLRVRGVDDDPAVQQVDDADLVVRVVAVERQPDALQGDLEVDDRGRDTWPDVDLGGVGDDPLAGGLRAVGRRLVDLVVGQLEGPVEEDRVAAVGGQLVGRHRARSGRPGRSRRRTGR